MEISAPVPIVAARELGVFTMTKFFRDFIRDDSGVAASEYVLLLALIGASIAAGAYYLGGHISAALSTKANYLSDCSTNPPSGTCANP